MKSISAICVFLLFSIVMVIDVVLATDPLSDYVISSNYSSLPNDDMIDTHITYKDAAGYNYEVELLEFKTSADNDATNRYIGKMVKEGQPTIYFQQTIFSDVKKQRLFYLSGRTLVIIGSKYDTNMTPERFAAMTDDDRNAYFQHIGNGEFPESLIEFYLANYPSNCDADSCDLLSQKEYIFEAPMEIATRVLSYSTIMLECPEQVTQETIIQKIHEFKPHLNSQFADEEIQAMIKECSAQKSFIVPGRQRNQESCEAELKNAISQRLGKDTEYNKKDIWFECELRKYFLSQHKELQQAEKSAELNFLMRERDNVFLSEVSAKDQHIKEMAREQELNRLPLGQLPEGVRWANKSIEDEIAAYLTAHNQSNDLNENLPANPEQKSTEDQETTYEPVIDNSTANPQSELIEEPSLMNRLISYLAGIIK
jgi:hypothetical protein